MVILLRVLEDVAGGDGERRDHDEEPARVGTDADCVIPGLETKLQKDEFPVVAFDLGDRARAWAFLDALGIIDISNNLGDAKSMATHPSTTTHRSMSESERLEIGLTEGWVRMSVGLEDAEDLAEDVLQALDKV